QIRIMLQPGQEAPGNTCNTVEPKGTALVRLATARDAHGTALIRLGRHGTRMGQHGTHMGHLMGIIKGRCTGHSFRRRAFTWDILGVKSRHMGQRSSHARNTLLSFGTSWDLYVPISTEPSTC